MRDFSKDRDVDIKILEKAIIGAKERGINTISLTGGEPILHESFEKILEMINKHNFLYSIVTNGSNTKKYIEIIKKYPGFTSFSFSLDGSTPEINDIIRMKGSYNFVMESIELCKENNLPFVIASTIGTKNFDDLKNIISVAKEKNASCLVLSTVLGNPNAKSNNMVLDWKKREKLFKKAKKLVKKNKDFPIYPGSPIGTEDGINPRLCGVMNLNFITLDVDGNINFCCNLADYSTENGASKEPIIASLNELTFSEAIEEYKKRTISFLKDRPDDYSEFEGNKINYNSCFYCLKKFNLD